MQIIPQPQALEPKTHGMCAEGTPKLARQLDRLYVYSCERYRIVVQEL
jgi:hypothetical protein